MKYISVIKKTAAVFAAAAISAGFASCGLTTENVKEESIPLENVSSITAELKSTDLRVRLGSENLLRYRVYESLAPTVTQAGGRLKIVSGEGRDFRIDSESNNDFIELTLTRKQLDDLDIELSSGDVVFDSFDINGSITTASGDIEIDNAENAGDVALKANSGDITVKDCNFKSLSKKTSSGDAVLENITADDMTLEATSGNTDIRCKKLCGIASESDSGDVNIRLSGSREEIGYELRAKSGSIKVGSETYDDNYVNIGSAPQKIKCSTSSGDITIDFI